MSGHGGGGSSAFGPIWWLIGVVIVLWIFWYLIGGSKQPGNDKPFMEPLSPVGGGEVYGPGDK